MKRPLIIAVIFLALASGLSPAHATTYRKGTTSASFLKIEVGPRAVALGGAYVGVADDALAGFWNPSGLATLSGTELTFQSSSLYAGLRQTFLAAGTTFNSRFALGLYVNHLDLGGFEETTLEKPDGTGRNFTARNVAVGLVTASELTDHVSIGLAAKFIEERIWYETSRNVALDLGTFYRFTEVGIRVGMLLSNLGPNSVMDQGSQLLFRKEKPEDYPGSPQVEAKLKTLDFPLPLMFTLGFSVDVAGERGVWVRSESNRLLLAVSANDAIDAPFRTNLGAEYTWHDVASLRAGYRFHYDTAGLSLGFGLNLESILGYRVRFDAAWLDCGDLDAVTMWSFSMGF